MQKECPKVAMKPMFKKTWVQKQANKEQKNNQEDSSQASQESYHLSSDKGKTSVEEKNVEKHKQSVKTKKVRVRKYDSKGKETSSPRNQEERTQDKKVHTQSTNGKKDKYLSVDSDDRDMQQGKLETMEASSSS